MERIAYHGAGHAVAVCMLGKKFKLDFAYEIVTNPYAWKAVELLAKELLAHGKLSWRAAYKIIGGTVDEYWE